MEKALLMLSGGPDSSTLAYWIKHQGYELHTLTFNFGEEEGEAEKRTANFIAKDISKSHKFISFESVLREFYMEDDPIHILRIAHLPSPIKAFGAGIAISLAASYAAENDIHHLFYAVHKDDTIFRENNYEFFNLLSKAISIELGREFKIHTPFLDKTKAEVLKTGFDLGVPLEETWSCASNSTIHCGWCDPCKNRQKAFKDNGMTDNTLYGNVNSKNSSVNV
ncbi:7-cyano-7-deazaguanine synthase [Bacillus sonorensis]|uniref:7-cyano-7-deazaguanine synthase n=4 Tax=Bacillus sonorensis TaxID=119858 RepID=A0ABN5AEN4_9BACI|nr:MULTISPECIES: 7-cyano-7-deazaguanine synthase [Bacillus]TWK84181.1 7-cyano-7-deazaguanine synthase [Bacillus paralicheniformis]ASB89193.1 7-cyano-7-deazaguanine synthase [Bacillus sonorensis]ASB89196.1 7-cyano-7-deazaguanine synthase [Bacillus sonorensis]MCY7858720.1 7-cyano-7-deazaguanine synthase [Bacillus sonorensis]MCY8026826.1 7-cyano-7-deazaguanine synthase [Bacillus sonorensis]